MYLDPLWLRRCVLWTIANYEGLAWSIDIDWGKGRPISAVLWRCQLISHYLYRDGIWKVRSQLLKVHPIRGVVDSTACCPGTVWFSPAMREQSVVKATTRPFHRDYVRLARPPAERAATAGGLG